MDSKGVKMQIYNIETKAIISGEEIKELDDCFILTSTDERNDMQTTIRCLKPTWNKVICKETCLQRITSQLNQLTQNTVLGVDELSNNTDTLMMRITLKNVKNKSLLIYNKQNKTTYIDCWFISSRFLDQAIEDYLTNKED
ncbi:hypothetical protein [Anaerostipes hadrus]|nr:hypothetical protein [Anaerostipes hadrus]